ncbi:MAG TPA: cobalamin-binding protein [Chthoniobacteraceae bacterium]|nr:cobalamin-binding protein [Chthoniobacteraceae bacterium]
MTGYPSRIVCLSAEAVEVLYRIGCGDHVAGVTRYAAEPPEARGKPLVGGFSDVDYEKIELLEPDLIITFSDVQAEAARELIRRGHTVLATNQRSLQEVFESILLIGRVVGREGEAEKLVAEMRAEIFANGEVPDGAKRPKVYFEEWDDPMISGIRWVSELIEAAGGADIFPELREIPRALERAVSGEEIIRRAPDIIVASWCGKKADLGAIRNRPGWNAVPAVRDGRVHEIKSAHILQPGPSMLRGFRLLREVIRPATR